MIHSVLFSFFSFCSFLLVEGPPKISIPGFNPRTEEGLVAPNTSAANSLTEHWFFTQGLPEWISYILIFAVAMAVLMVVLGGVMLLLSGANEDYYENGKKTIQWALIGLVVSSLSYTAVEVVNTLPFTGENPEGDVFISQDGFIGNLLGGDLRTSIIPGIIKLVLGLLGTVTFGLFLYAGSLMVMRNGEDEAVSKGKKIMIMSLVGLGIVALSYAIVEAILQFSFERNE